MAHLQVLPTVGNNVGSLYPCRCYVSDNVSARLTIASWNGHMPLDTTLYLESRMDTGIAGKLSTTLGYAACKSICSVQH